MQQMKYNKMKILKGIYCGISVEYAKTDSKNTCK